MLTRVNKVKTLVKYWMVQHVIRIQNGKTISFNVIVKSITYPRNIIVGILAHVFVRVIGIEKVLLIIQ